MASSRARSPSPLVNPAKRLKISHEASPVIQDPTPHFASGLLEEANISRLHDVYGKSEPFKFAILEKLFQDELLKNVKDECLRELNFTMKETDIYKIHQTGDLASLSYLDEEQLALFPNLLILRDALYSPSFRKFIQTVTGCGALSGSNQDMAVSTYRKGCHLLNHDDVIGSRRVSYILYMPLPCPGGWKKEWGGALELYPTLEGEGRAPEPQSVPSMTIPPSWNQFVFFEVQPGKSFHAVEEVVVGGEADERQRLSISGWFHAAQEGEDGYEPMGSTGRSSREQLVSTSSTFTPFPATELSLPTKLSKEQVSFLSEWLNPSYLDIKTLQSLLSTFADESNLELHSFLCEPLAERLENVLRARDLSDGLAHTRDGHIPPHHAGLNDDWILQGPPIKWRFAALSSSPISESNPPSLSSSSSLEEMLFGLREHLFKSEAFRAWLGVITSLMPLGYAVESRRFRPGLDYTLATSDPNEARLDVVLGLTPTADVFIGGEEGDNLNEWDAGDWGGWEAYIAPPDDDDDPAVYQSGPSKAREANTSDSQNGAQNRNASDTTVAAPVASSNLEDEDEDGEGEEDVESLDEGDGSGTLLTVTPTFNSLLLVLRDQHVMRFVKYVSAAAAGSRWDVCGEYEVGKIEEDLDDDP